MKRSFDIFEHNLFWTEVAPVLPRLAYWTDSTLVGGSWIPPCGQFRRADWESEW